jgi:hypothetical protein
VKIAKVVPPPPAFVPIVFTIETPQEAAILASLLGGLGQSLACQILGTTGTAPMMIPAHSMLSDAASAAGVKRCSIEIKVHEAYPL